VIAVRVELAQRVLARPLFDDDTVDRDFQPGAIPALEAVDEDGALAEDENRSDITGTL